MNCTMQQVGTEGNRRKHQCTRCGFTLTSPYPAENINAPCNGWPRWWELGWWIEFALAVVGINQRRWNWLRFKLGFTTSCGCGNRIETLNASGGWVKDRIDVLGAAWRRITSAGGS